MLTELRTNAGQIIRNVCMNQVAASILVPRLLRQAIYRFCGARIMTRWVAPRCFMGGTNITIGQGTFLNYECFLDSYAAITIGSNCNLGMQVLLVTSTHAWGSRERRGNAILAQPIVIGNGCWLGARVTVLPGVSIGEGCIIAAGALVTRDCLPNGLYAGSPARRVKELE